MLRLQSVRVWSSQTGEDGVSAVVAPFPECAFLAYIPNYELRTRDSRGVLPKKLSYKAVAASSMANVA